MNKDNKDTPKSYCWSLEMGLPCGCQFPLCGFGFLPLNTDIDYSKYGAAIKWD